MMLKMPHYLSHIVVGICLLKVDGCEICSLHSINALILIAPFMSDIKFLLVLLRYKTFHINFPWKVISFRNIHFFFFYNLFENRSVLQSELLFFICYMFIYSLVKTFF